MKKKSLVKKTLLPAIIAVVCSLLALTTVSYAWFTMGNTARVESIDVNVVSADGMQMSANAVSWKSIIDVSELEAGYTDEEGLTISKNQLPNENFESMPLSSVGNVVCGLQEMFMGTIQEDGTLVSTKEEEGGDGNFIAFDLFINLASDKVLMLDKGSSVVAITEEGEEVKHVDYAVRVSFINLGTVATAEEAKKLYVDVPEFTQKGDEDEEYALGEWVQFDGKVYECIVPTKLSPADDAEAVIYWEKVTNWTDNDTMGYLESQSYVIGDVMVHDGQTYECIAETTGVLDLECWNPVTLYEEVNDATQYEEGDYLEFEEELYKCVQAGDKLPSDNVDAIDNWEEKTAEAVVWEPNANLHTVASGATGAVEYYGVKAESNKVNEEYVGFDQNDTSSDKLQKVTTIKPAQYTEDNEETPEVEVAQETSEAAELFEIGAGYTKIRVYIWLEGQDVDCQNDVSDSQYQVNLKFIAENAE